MTTRGSSGPLPVDVVIPAWGSYAELLPRAVGSARGATVVAVVDTAAEQRAHELGCRVVRRPAGGIGPARNAGAAAGSSPFVLFLDADDELLPGALEGLVHRLEAAPPDVLAVAGELQRRSDGSTWPARPWGDLAAARGLGPLLLWRNCLPAVGATLIRRSVVAGGGLFPDLEDEDWHAVVRLRAHGDIAFRRGAVLRYTDDPGSVSRRPRDPAALERSHARLVRAARGARPFVPWVVADALATPARRRAARALTATWGRTPQTAPRDHG